MDGHGSEQDESKQDAASARAEVAVLRELMAVAAHDLSNPLQSLSVLLELTLDELSEGSAAETKIESSLAAAEQLRVLIRGIAEFARPPGRNRRSLGRTLDACVGVCARRFERQRIAFTRETAAVDALAPVPSETRVAVLSLLLGCVHAAGQSGLAEHRVALVGRTDDEASATLEVEFLGEDDGGEDTALAIDTRYVVRARDAVGAIGGHVDRVGTGRVRLTVAVERETELAK